MDKKKIALLFLCAFTMIYVNVKASPKTLYACFSINNSQQQFHNFTNKAGQSKPPFILFNDPALTQLNTDSITKHRRLVAAILAFPFPFGMFGLHRIYLGTKPIVPIVYIATAGGVFGILPFIDFVVILADRKIDTYVNNPRVFMWVNQSPPTAE